jgi:hypothetical protein
MSNNIARHRIDGAWVTSDRVSPSINPSDGELLGRFADGGVPGDQDALPHPPHLMRGALQ